MKQMVYSVYDSKVQAYLRPFHARADGEAVRMVLAVAREPQSPFAMYPGDYTLFRVAEFDDDKGTFVSYSAHENLGTVLSILSTNPTQEVGQ